MKNLFGKNVIVPGCSRGVRRSDIKLLKSNGANVIGISRNISNLSESDKTFLNEYICHDLAFAVPDELVHNILNNFKSIDILIHAAGSLIPGEFKNLTENEIVSVVNSNLISTFTAVKTFSPQMKNQGNGHIIIVGSLGGILPLPYEALYSSVKFAVRGFCLSIAEELKEYGIKISLVSPEPIKTKMLDKESRDVNSVISFMTKPMQPEIIATEIIKLIDKPKIEIIIPRIYSLISMIPAIRPGLFYKYFGLMKKSGARKRKAYQNEYLISGMN